MIEYLIMENKRITKIESINALLKKMRLTEDQLHKLDDESDDKLIAWERVDIPVYRRKNRLLVMNHNVADFMINRNYKPDWYDNNKIPFKDIYSDYLSYCIETSSTPVFKKEFGARLRAVGFDVKLGTCNRTFVHAIKESKYMEASSN